MNVYRLKLGVGTKTLIALSLVFWIPVSALALLLSHLFEDVLQAEVTDRINVHFRGAMSVYEKRTAMLENLLAQLAERADVREAVSAGDSGRLQTLLLDFGKQYTFVSLLAAVDANQRVISRRNGSRGDVMTLGNALPDALLSGRVLSTNELVSGDVLAQEDRELTNAVSEPGVVRYAVAPIHAGERVVGALVGGILLSADSWLGNTVYDRFGVELALFAGAPREPFLLHATTSLPRTIWSWGQVMPAPLKQEIQRGKPFQGVIELPGLRITAAFEAIKDSRNRIIGAIGVAAPLEEVHAAVTVTIAKAIGVTALIGLVVALVSVFFVHHDITRPLGLLNTAMSRFGEGELGTRVTLSTGDQLEALGHGFNAMAEGIRRREERFKKHNEVAKLFMSTMDMDQLLDKTLRIVVAVTESQLGILYLWEEEGQCLMPRAQYGTSARLEPLGKGEGYPGRAAQDRQRLMLRPTEAGQVASIEMGFMQSVPSEVVYIPLAYQENVLGVLVLGSVKPFREDEVQLFDYLADQISIALDNAWMHQRIQELSITDGLTHLYNRRFLNTRLEQEWSRSQRKGTALSLLLSDVDNFKSINDLYGHGRGDEVLRQLAEIFKRNARKEDLVARYGGEEFVVVLIDTPAEAARKMAERICADARSQEYRWMDRSVTLSIGIASFPENHFDSFEGLLQAADQAMYKAKTTGKNKVEVYVGAGAGRVQPTAPTEKTPG